MQRKRGEFLYFIWILCLITSCICFDDVKANGRVSFSAASGNPSQNYTTGITILNEDACTLEMLETAHSSLLTLQPFKNHGEQQKHSETHSFAFCDESSLQIPFKFYTSLNAAICIANTDTAKFIQYIHNQDGKKRI